MSKLGQPTYEVNGHSHESEPRVNIIRSNGVRANGLDVLKRQIEELEGNHSR